MIGGFINCFRKIYLHNYLFDLRDLYKIFLPRALYIHKNSLTIIPVASWILSKASLYDYTRPYYSTWSIHWHNAYLNCCFSLIHLLRFFLCFHFFNVLVCFSALLILFRHEFLQFTIMINHTYQLLITEINSRLL